MNAMRTFLAKRGKRLLRALDIYLDQPDWDRVIRASSYDWQRARADAANGPNVLIATSHGGHRPSTTVEGLLAAALTLRGAHVHVLLCDGVLPACMLCSYVRFPNTSDFIREGPQRRACGDCAPVGRRMYEQLGLKIHTYSELISEQESQLAATVSATIPSDQIADYQLDGLAVGEHAQAGALRFFARGTLPRNSEGEAVLRRYFHASLLSVFATRGLLARHDFTAMCFNHGIYVPQGLIGEVAREQNVRVVNWNPGYRKQRFIFSHADTYHHTLLAEPTADWENITWSPELDEEALTYLHSRWNGSRDWISYLHKDAVEEIETISRTVGVDFSRPVIGMLTNVMWDAQLHYPANAFPNMLVWALETIEYFRTRPDLQLVIRIHPAELTGSLPSQQPLHEEIMRAFPELPANVFVIPPESRVSTYALASQCNAVIIYGTKTGVELTSVGIPVIVAGEAWIRNKGVTIDVTSPSEYRNILDGLPFASGMDAEQVERARKYAYHFFFRRMIPIQTLEPSELLPPYVLGVKRLEDLLPGQDPGLDVVCEGILNGSEFVYPAEKWLPRG